MSLILVANLLNNARQVCTREALIYNKKNEGRGRNCPQYAVVLFSVNSYFINDDLNFVSKNITNDLLPYLPLNNSPLKINELRFVLEVSLKYKLPHRDFSLPSEYWNWDYMSQFIPEKYEWVNDLEYNRAYIFNVKGPIQELQTKYKLYNCRGDLTSTRITVKSNSHKAVSYVGKIPIGDLELLDINNLPINNLNRSLLCSVIDQGNTTFYQTLIENRTVEVPTAYSSILAASV